MDSDPVARVVGDRVQRYVDHVEGVERRAVEFGKPLGLESEARLFARYHDLDKLRKEWQGKVGEGGSAGDVDLPSHAPYSRPTLHMGPSSSLRTTVRRGLPLAAVMYGHHSRIYDPKGPADRIRQFGAEELESPAAEGSWTLPECPSQGGFWLRMLFSVGVDADRLDAEAFTQGPREEYKDLQALWDAFREGQEELMEETSRRRATGRRRARRPWKRRVSGN